MDGAGPVREAGGDGDDPGADGRGPGGGPGAGGEVPGGAGEVVGDAGAGQPGVVGGEPAGWQVRQRAGDQIRVDLFDDRVLAALGFGLGQRVGLSVKTAW